MDVTVRKIDSVTILDLDGRLTLAENPLKLQNLLEVLLRENQHQFVLNMQNVRLLDCAGIGQLILCYLRVRKSGGDLKLLNLSRRLLYLLQKVRILTVIEVFDDEPVAISSFPFRTTLMAPLVPESSPDAPSEMMTDRNYLSSGLVASRSSHTRTSI